MFSSITIINFLRDRLGFHEEFTFYQWIQNANINLCWIPSQIWNLFNKFRLATIHTRLHTTFIKSIVACLTCQVQFRTGLLMTNCIYQFCILIQYMCMVNYIIWNCVKWMADISSPIFFAVFQKLYDGHFIPKIICILLWEYDFCVQS